MKFTLEAIEAASEAGRMYLPEEEKKAFWQGINQLGGYAAIIREVDTKDVPATTYVLPLLNIYRNDRQEPSLPREIAMANAPDEDGVYFKVPKIIEK